MAFHSDLDGKRERERKEKVERYYFIIPIF